MMICQNCNEGNINIEVGRIKGHYEDGCFWLCPKCRGTKISIKLWEEQHKIPKERRL